MKSVPPVSTHYVFFVGVALVAFAVSRPLQAQNKASDSGKQTDTGVEASRDLAAQVRELQAKIAKLETALQKSGQGMSSGMAGMGGQKQGMDGMMVGMGGKKQGMGGMEAMKSDEMMGQMMQKMGEMMQMMGGMQGNGMSSMGGMDDKQKMGMGMMGGPGMGGPQSKGMGGVQINVQENETISMMGMMGMGRMGQDGMKGMTGMGKMQMTAALPGFPGASHIYHIGATGFFLDHPEHIKLTTKQQTTLNGLKEKALLEKSTNQRKIDEAEQVLWTLTASDQPDATKVGAKVGEIEKLRGDQRLAFIRAVGEAAEVLTDEQRKTVLGEVTPDTTEKAPAHSAH